MDNREERHQLEELRTLLKRAERSPNRSSGVRKDTLKRLIELAHSPYGSLKSLAASNFRFFIKDFPELEDDAINAVYDLCEDPAPKIRIDGYQAIVSVSKEQRKWVKRNADVLVQLLQSDEPEEVAFVKKALIEHLDMDPVVTLGVLCDQIVPLEEPVDEEDQSIRNRLRSLVLAFLTGEAYRGITERHANTPGSQAEITLVSGLLKAIPKLPHAEVNIAVKDLLLFIPSFGKLSNRGDELLEVILDTTRASLKAELASGAAQVPLTNTTYFLELALLLAVEKRVANPKLLLRFYCASLVSKLTLLKLTEDGKALVLGHVADTLLACEDVSGAGCLTADDLASLRKQVVEACTLLLPCFAEINSEDKRPWRACCTLLKTCTRRKDEAGWTPPSLLGDTLQKIQTMAEAELEQGASTSKASIEEAQSLIRPLLPPPGATSKLSISTSTPSLTGSGDGKTTSDNNRDKPNGSPVIIQRNRESRSGPLTAPGRPNSLPPKPPASVSIPSSSSRDTNGVQQQPRRDQQRQPSNFLTAQLTKHLNINPGPNASSSSGADNKLGSGTVPNFRSSPKASSSGDGSVGQDENPSSSSHAPSLLSRLAAQRPTNSGSASVSPVSGADVNIGSSSRSSTASIPAKRRADSSTVTAATTGEKERGSSSRRSTPPARQSVSDANVDMDPIGGWSIKGAAKAGNREQNGNDSGSGLLPRPASLLDRIMKDKGGDGEGSSGSAGGGGERDGRGRKRTRNF